MPGFGAGVDWVDSQLSDRSYTVGHAVVEGEMAAASFLWTANRRSDGGAVAGKGAYHCRIVDGRIAENRDLFSPMERE